MSRSRRKSKAVKCCCGRLLTRYKEFIQHLRGPTAECARLFPVHERNEEFLKYRERRSHPLTEED